MNFNIIIILNFLLLSEGFFINFVKNVFSKKKQIDSIKVEDLYEINRLENLTKFELKQNKIRDEFNKDEIFYFGRLDANIYYNTKKNIWYIDPNVSAPNFKDKIITTFIKMCVFFLKLFRVQM